MYRIMFKGTIITVGQESLEKAIEVKKELSKHFFSNFSADELIIIDEHNNPVNVNDLQKSYKK